MVYASFSFKGLADGRNTTVPLNIPQVMGAKDNKPIFATADEHARYIIDGARLELGNQPLRLNAWRPC